MAEVAGLVLGGLGVVGLFSVCVQAFDMVELARTQERSLRVLATKLDNQKARFMIWGESLDLDKPDGPDRRLDHPVIQKRIHANCELIYELFTDSTKLRSRYGLADDITGSSSAGAGPSRPQQSV